MGFSVTGFPPEPKTIREALNTSEGPHWQAAMEEELRNLQEMHTWEVCELPANRRAIPCMWVFKRKLNADGSIERYKARLVIKGFHQQHLVDYDKVFAPVVRASTVRLFFSIVAAADLVCHMVDISNAFVQGTADKVIFMCQPPGFEDGTGNVLKLLKSLYGLKQAPRVWNQTLTNLLLSIGCVRSQSDGAMFTLCLPSGSLVYLLVYVDDIQIASKNTSDVEHVKQLVLSTFKGRDIGETQFFLQMSVERDRSRRLLVLRQQRHVDQLVQASGLGTACPKSLPMITGIYNDPIGEEITDPAVVSQYRSLVGAVMHISNFTRPDVAFAVSYLARFMHRPTASLFARVQDLICYLKGTASYGLYLGGASPQCPLYAYCDSDYANCREDRRSVTGLVVKCGVGSICWKSAKQPTVSRSTAEAEYIAAGEVAKEVQYVHALAQGMQLDPGCIPIGIDNRAALFLVEDPVSAARTKHIDVVYHHVRERVKCRQMEFEPIATELNVSDIFTKPLAVDTFAKHRSGLGIMP
jgi:hypothetical protein